MGSRAFVSWKEVLISKGKGRREVHYYLKRSDGRSDLAVVGKEKSLRHMSYAVSGLFLRSLRPSSPLRWRSRREVVDWLSSLITDSYSDSSSPIGRLLNDEDSFLRDDPTSKDLSSDKLKHQSKEFSWVGSPWTCWKRRKHYKSFCRNGITISVHEFVHVMAEENKRLVAYLEDLYEDSRGNNMVVVQWFHKIDEIGIAAPPGCNDREIFFSLCQQVIRVECIDGLAAVLNPQHFEKYLNEAAHTLWEPYLCHRQFDNDDFKTFDITQVQGYWKQDLLRYLYMSMEAMRSRPKRKIRLRTSETNLHHKAHVKGIAEVACNSNVSAVDAVDGRLVSSCGLSATDGTKFPRNLVLEKKHQQDLSAGCTVEVLSQDSGIRGCWLRGVILKRCRDKLKVRYKDIQDADGTGYLEEWILASRVAVPDEFGFRMHGRAIVRPHPPPKGSLSIVFDVGTAVDAWWHDGWWEGILIRRGGDKFHVFFPGERRMSVFGCSELRRSLDWVCNRWIHIEERPDIGNLILSDQRLISSDAALLFQLGIPEKHPGGESMAHEMAVCDTKCKDERDSNLEVPNLARHKSFAQLKWNPSRKRRRSRESAAKVGSYSKRRHDGSSSSCQEDEPRQNRFLVPKSFTVDLDNCKYEGNHPFSASILSHSSLLTSR